MAEATPPGSGVRAPFAGAGQRPTLFSAGADDTLRIEPETSIMAALDGRVARPATVRRGWPKWGGLGLVALAAGLAGWWWPFEPVTPTTQPEARAASATEQQVALRVAEPAPSMLSAASAPVEVASAAAPRAVIEETVAGEPKAVAQTPAASANAASAVLPATLAAASAGMVVATTTGDGAAAERSRNARDKVASKPAVAAAPVKTTKLSVKATANDDKPPTAATESAPRDPAAKDADVELLAALIHYSDETSTATAGKGKAPGSASRMNELTIADLVKRCKALGGDEATQCKRRICSGYWGKAEACPAKQAPAAGKPKHA